MDKSIFDLAEQDQPVAKSKVHSKAKTASGDAAIFDLVDDAEYMTKFQKKTREAEKEDSSYFQQAANFGKNAAKAAAQGLQKVGHAWNSPINVLEGKLEDNSHEFQENFSKQLEKAVPSEEGGPISNVAEYVLKEAPTNLSFPGGTALGTLARTAGAGTAKEGVKQLGGGEVAQTAAEVLAYLTPDLAKKLLTTKDNAKFIAMAKEFGLTEEQIMPLLNSETKKKYLSKLAASESRTGEQLGKTKGAIDEARTTLANSKEAQAVLSEKQAADVIKKIEDQLFEIPDTVRTKIINDFADLKSKPITGQSLMNFFTDINANMTSKTKQLRTVKDVITNALHELSPDLGKKFKGTNELYSAYFDIAKKVKPSILNQIASYSQASKILGALAFPTHAAPILGAFVAEKAITKLASRLLTDPRFHGLTEKLASALSQNSPKAANAILKSMREEVRKIDPEIADQLEDLDFNDILSKD